MHVLLSPCLPLYIPYDHLESIQSQTHSRTSHSFSPFKHIFLSIQVIRSLSPSQKQSNSLLSLDNRRLHLPCHLLVFHAHPTLIALSHMHASLSLLSPPTFPLTRTTMKLSHSSLIPSFAAEDHPRSQPRLTQISLIFKASKRNIKQRRVLATLQDHRTSMVTL